MSLPKLKKQQEVPEDCLIIKRKKNASELDKQRSLSAVTISTDAAMMLLKEICNKHLKEESEKKKDKKKIRIRRKDDETGWRERMNIGKYVKRTKTM